jgi:hypothetical protein
MTIELEMGALFAAAYNTDLMEVGSLACAAWRDQDKHPEMLELRMESVNCSISFPRIPSRKRQQLLAAFTPRVALKPAKQERPTRGRRDEARSEPLPSNLQNRADSAR